MAHSMPGIYAPLPQSLSDSDSEKEVNMDFVIGNFSKNCAKASTKSNMTCQHNGHLFNNLSVEINKPDRIQPRLFGLRKLAFCFSLLLCVLPVVIFLWILPCSDINTCPVKIVNWEKQEKDIEFKGPVNLVYGAFKNTLNLAVMYEGSFNTPRVLKNGVMSFMGRSGAVAWNFEQETYPIEMNCTIIDVDLNGVNDCLVVDDKLGLKAIEALSGEVLWHAHSAQGKPIPELDMPVKLEDIDNDGVDDLLSIYQKNTFFLISSKTGKVFFNMKLSTICTSIYSLQKVVETIRYKCLLPDGTQTIFSLSVSNIIMKFRDNQAKIVPVQIHDEDIEKNFVSGNRRLSVEIYGRCPHCQSTLTLFDSINVIKTWTYKNTFVTTPVPYELDYPNLISAHSQIHGFIFKIWEWHAIPKKLTPVTNVHKRSIPVYNETYHVNEVTEKVVLIIFHQNDTQIINISVTEVYVICKGPSVNDCQPDYRNQEHSLLVADLDRDNVLELVSYYSSYIKTEENGVDNWNLISKLNVFSLESELPKLYGQNNLSN